MSVILLGVSAPGCEGLNLQPPGLDPGPLQPWLCRGPDQWICGCCRGNFFSFSRISIVRGEVDGGGDAGGVVLQEWK